MRQLKWIDLSIDTHARFYRVIDTLMLVMVVAAPILAVRLVIDLWWWTARFRFVQTVRRGPADEVAARREAKRRRA